MLNNIFKHSFRFLSRQKGYLLINVIGLSVGIACSMIIALFIIHELSFDQFNVKKDRIFRLDVHGKVSEREINVAITPAPFGPTMLRDFPEVEDFTRISLKGGSVVKYMDKNFIENGFFEADSSFFNIFSIPLLRGDSKTVLNASHKLVLSESTAKRIFGEEDPMDKTLKIGNDDALFRVTGVMADIPENSHFKANMIASFMTYSSADDNNWQNNSYITYILLNQNTDPQRVNVKIREILRKYLGPGIQQSFGISFEEFIAKNEYKFYLQPLQNIHLNPTITQFTKPASNPKYLFIFGSVAILIIIIAAINFMNLSTAQASKRAKEVGIKKVSGSSKGMLVRQFLTESTLLSFLSLVLAIIFVETALPYFNNLLGVNLQMNYFNNWVTIPVLFVLAVFIGVLAGSYPAFFLASFNPYLVLKGKLVESMKNGRLRSIMVILQFSISIVLIIGTIIMFRQIHFMINKDLGFNKEQLLVIDRADIIGNRIDPFKEAIAKIPNVIKVASSTAVPGHSESGYAYMVEGKSGEVYDFRINYVDSNYFDTYGIKFLSGRAFNKLYATDRNACIVNECAVKRLSIGNPFTTRLVEGDNKLSIIGVVRNFHYEALQTEINPYIFRLKEKTNYGFISLKLSKNATASTIKEIEKVWKDYASNDPIQYFFMDQDFALKYKEEKQNAQLSVIFSILAIIVAALGLFGLTSFTIEQRTKEIGIRKTMGTPLISIFYLISKEFIILVSISTVIAWPLIYFIANNWLQNYYYRITLSPSDFLIGFIIAFVITLITISYRTIKLALTNPIEALRFE
jgi:putative ABC transport system permease protein